MKYRNLCYKFRRSNKLFINDTPIFFQIHNDTLNIKNVNGFITNSFLIDKFTDNELVLIEKGKTGFTDDNCIKYYFSKEKNYLNHIPLKSSDIVSISNTDTLYRCGRKIHPIFVNNKSFYDYWLRNSPDNNNLADSSFLATFIVRKTGIIDNVVILKKINKFFEKQFLKALNETKNSWLPGELGDKKVDVQVEISFKIRKTDKDKSILDYFNKGDQVIKNLDYGNALEYYNLILEISPDNYIAAYYKSICEIKLGHKAAACETLGKINSGSYMNVDELIEINCKEK